MYDIIGDIHGHARTLKALLKKLGYSRARGFYSHPSRKAVFTGDFIDRGPRIAETLSIVKSMVDNRSAFSVLGNHEYNAITFLTRDGKGSFLRKHTDKNYKQLEKTFKEFENIRETGFMYLKWLQTLPLYLEFPAFRVIHACWDFNLIEFVKNRLENELLTNEFLKKSVQNNTIEYEAVDILLKGKEAPLPKDTYFIDQNGGRRHSVRYKWWTEFKNKTYRSVAVNFEEEVPDVEVPQSVFKDHIPYMEGQRPIFFGHYWKRGKPEILSKNVCCVDYSIAKKQKLAAYRFDGEQELCNDKFVYINDVD